MLNEPLESGKISVERFLEGGIFVVCDILILIFCKKGWKYLGSWETSFETGS